MAPPGKRAVIPRRSDYTKQFRKDWERLDRSGRFAMRDLKQVMTLLVENDAPLPAQYKDHTLAGEWSDHRECHIHGDFLLIYRLDDGAGAIIFVRAGTHADLFE